MGESFEGTPLPPSQAPVAAPTLRPLDAFRGDDAAGHRSNADFARGEGAGAAAASDAAAEAAAVAGGTGPSLAIAQASSSPPPQSYNAALGI